MTAAIETQLDKAEIIASIIKDAQDAIELATGEKIILTKRRPFFSKKKFRMDKICYTVAEYYGYTPDQFKGHIKNPGLSIARFMSSYLSYLIYGSGSLQEIANFYGLKNHTTIHHHVKQMTGFLEIYPSYKTDLENIRWILEEN